MKSGLSPACASRVHSAFCFVGAHPGGGDCRNAGRGAALLASASSVIAEIHATGSNHYADEQVAAACGLKPGDAVTLEQLQAAADRLAQLGVFSKVNYRFTTHGDKIVVEFQLADAPTVPVTFDNFPWFTDEELAAAIRQAVPFFDGTAPQGGALLDTVTAAVSTLLEAHGISGNDRTHPCWLSHRGQ